MRRAVILSLFVVFGCRETDPVFTDSPAATASDADLSRWNQAHAWGDHASAGYLSSESDPLFSASAARALTASDVANWNGAYSWGDHSTFGYAAATDLAWHLGPSGVEARPGGAAPVGPILTLTGADPCFTPVQMWQSFTVEDAAVLTRFVAPFTDRATRTFRLRGGAGRDGPILFETTLADVGALDVPLPLVSAESGQQFTAEFVSSGDDSRFLCNFNSSYGGGALISTAVEFEDTDMAITLYGRSAVVVTNDARVGINTRAPTAPLDVEGDTIRLRRPRTPVSATAPCRQGEQTWDSDYVYVCVAENSWRRAALQAW